MLNLIHMKFEAITIKDIAKALGLSTSTAKRNIKVPEEMGIVGLIQIIESKHPITKYETRVLNTELSVKASSSKIK